MATEPTKGRVLIVDDEEGIRLYLRRVLADAGYTVAMAETGEEALRIAQADPALDAMILDIQLPKISGYEVCATLKREPRLVDVPVIFLTALLTGEEDERHGLELGAHEYLQKGPGMEDVILAKLPQLIEVRRMFGA